VSPVQSAGVIDPSPHQRRQQIEGEREQRVPRTYEAEGDGEQRGNHQKPYRQLPPAQMRAFLELGHEQGHAHADQCDQERMAGIEPDRRRHIGIAADHDGGERNAGDQQQIEQPPVDVFTPNIFGARAELDIGQPAQAEDAKTEKVGQQLWPQSGKPSRSSAPSLGRNSSGRRTSKTSKAMATAKIPSLRVSKRALENMPTIELTGIYAKTSGFFGASRSCSIDFGPFHPMFRLEAATCARKAIP
jgi:hypothetical protein